jgi:hypothetical protein
MIAVAGRVESVRPSPAPTKGTRFPCTGADVPYMPAYVGQTGLSAPASSRPRTIWYVPRRLGPEPDGVGAEPRV